VAPWLSPGPLVSRRGLDPSALTAQMSWVPARIVYTRTSPFGDHRGCVWRPLDVSGRTLAPSASITNTCGVPVRSEMNAISRPVVGLIEPLRVTGVAPMPSWSAMRISLTPRPLWSTYAIFVSATPASPVNCSTVSSAILCERRRHCGAGISNFFEAMSRCSAVVRSYSLISVSTRSPRKVTSPCSPAWAPVAARTPAKVTRFTSSSSRSGVVESEVDPEECLLKRVGQGRERRRVGDRAQRRLVVERIAGGLLDREPADLPVAADLEDHLRLGAVARLTFPSFADLALNLPQVPRKRKVRGVQRQRACALRRAGRTSQRRGGRRHCCTVGWAERHGRRRRAGHARQLFLAWPGQRGSAGRQRPIGQREALAR